MVKILVCKFEPFSPHLVYLVAAWRAGCHERWDEFDPPHGPPRLLPEPPRWPPVEPVGPPDDCCCHGAHRLGHAPWFHAHDHPPIYYIFFNLYNIFKFIFFIDHHHHHHVSLADHHKHHSIVSIYRCRRNGWINLFIFH